METELKKIISFIKDTFEKAGKKTAVIGLSGGIDSAVSFALTAKAIGIENIYAYHLPSRHSNPIHLKDVNALISKYQFPISNFRVIPIQSIIQKSWRIIKSHTTVAEADALSEAFQANSMNREEKSVSEATKKLRLANMAARTRMIILFDQAKRHDALVMGTENKSEHMLGYFTRFGDEASDIEPIVHLYKTQVIELAKSLEIPESIITKSPSADLWVGQTDAAELGFTYAEADPILALIEAHKPLPNTPLANAVKKQVESIAFKHEVPYTLHDH